MLSRRRRLLTTLSVVVATLVLAGAVGQPQLKSVTSGLAGIFHSDCPRGASGLATLLFAQSNPCNEPKATPPPWQLAEVVEIKSLDGRSPVVLEIFRDGRWQSLSRYDPVRKGDRIRTGKNTAAALELDLGGRVYIRPDSAIVVEGERSVKGIRSTPEGFRVTKGGVWAKCGQMKESIEIQTTGGVMGIKG